jgi:molybdopterin molybdotransferase
MEFIQGMPLGQAKDLIAESVDGIIVQSETVQLTDALGRIAAEDIIAQEDLPPFSRSTVDGFAVRSADTFGASEASPSMFTIVGEVLMGEQASITLSPGQAVAIPTGGMLPTGADAIVMLEYTERLDDHTMLALKTVAPGENMVVKGEDMQSGLVIVEQGRRLAPQHIGALAACGHIKVLVRKRPEVAIISTGDELVDIHESPGFGKIRDVNSYALGAMLSEAGCMVRLMGIVKDSYEQFHETLAKAVATSQMVIISGGSSVGARDFTVKAMDSLGAPGVLLHGVALKPGKPTIYGKINNVPVFGLPGHPVAAMAVCDNLVRLAVRKLMGEKQPGDTVDVPARLARNVASVPGRDDFIPVRLSKQGGEYTADPILGKSGLISIMAQAEGMMHIASDKSGVYAGEMVEVLLFNKRGG